MPVKSITSSSDSLTQIHADLVSNDSLPLYTYRIENNYLAVSGEGSAKAHTMIIGEAPGEKEALSGRPFCGAAGKVLNELLASINLSREDIFITNIVKDRPPKNRDPQPDEIALYAPYLDRQIDCIQPKIIATLGRFSSDYIMNRYGLHEHISPISSMHGQIFIAQRPWGSVSIVPLYHPAVALYRRSMKATLMKDFHIIKQVSE